MNNITKIYLVSNIDFNSNKVYIGKTKNTRYYKHINKFGKNIEYVIIDEINSLDYKDWEPLETYWIEQFRQWGFEIVNIRKKGGSGSEYCSEQTKIKIGKANSKPKPKGFGDYFKNNNVRSNKIKESLSKINRGPSISEGRKKPILQYDLQGNIIKEWKSIIDAKEGTNIKGIPNVVTGLARTAGSYIWKYK
jgi:hypothetical protein